MKSSPILKIDTVSKSYGAVHALSGVSLDVFPGEVLAVIGENGAGKSTFLRLLQGEHQPDIGHIIVSGETIRLSGPAQARKLGIRVVHQEPEINGGVSVAENLYMGELPRTALRWLKKRELIAEAQAHIDELGFGSDISASAMGDDLSTAQRQLVEIARAMKPGVRVLALDEPTSSLTEDQVARLLSAIKTAQADGVAIIYVSHRLREVLTISDRIAVLRDGNLVDVSPSKGATEAHLIRSMVGRDLSAVFPPRATNSSVGDVVLEASHLESEWLHDVSITLRAGEVVGIGGLIGSGRSELAKTLFGALPLTSGAILLSGKPVRLKSPATAIARGIGFAPEDRRAEALFGEMSVMKNTTISVLKRLRWMRFVKRANERSLAQSLTSRLRVKTPTIDQLVSALSGGNAQKVVLARWLAVSPKVLILDEPTRGIDVGAKAEIYHLIRTLADSGLAILFISSELPEVLGISDRIAVMREGRLVSELSPDTATEESILRLAMLEQ
ncbi:sugar ABC transporter ATP-binding protein [soil metagenome]